VTEFPGLYVVGLPWLTRHYSSIVGGVGLDAEYVAGRVAGDRRRALNAAFLPVDEPPGSTSAIGRSL